MRKSPELSTTITMKPSLGNISPPSIRTPLSERDRATRFSLQLNSLMPLNNNYTTVGEGTIESEEESKISYIPEPDIEASQTYNERV